MTKRTSDLLVLWPFIFMTRNIYVQYLWRLVLPKNGCCDSHSYASFTKSTQLLRKIRKIRKIYAKITENTQNLRKIRKIDKHKMKNLAWSMQILRKIYANYASLRKKILRSYTKILSGQPFDRAYAI